MHPGVEGIVEPMSHVHCLQKICLIEDFQRDDMRECAYKTFLWILLCTSDVPNSKLPKEN